MTEPLDAVCCPYCEGWHDPATCPEQDADPFLDADLWEAEAARVNAQLIADVAAAELPDAAKPRCGCRSVRIVWGFWGSVQWAACRDCGALTLHHSNHRREFALNAWLVELPEVRAAS